MSPTEKHLHKALIELRSAVSDLRELVHALAWGSSAVSIHNPLFGHVNTALVECGKSLDAATQPQQEVPRRCAAIQHSDQMVCDRCKAAWDVNDPEPPECLPASADAELAKAIGEHEKDCATCAHQTLPAYAPKCQQCNRLATGARRNWQATS